MGLIPEEIISQVLDRTDIVETVSGYIPLKRAGRNFKANCPFHHEKTPSFVVNPDKQIFHCFGCSVGGNVVSFVMKHDHLEFPEAIRMLASKAGVVIPETETRDPGKKNLRQLIYQVNSLAAEAFHNNLITGNDKQAKEAIAYLKSRQVSLETAKLLKIGFAADSWDALIDTLRKKDVSLTLIEKAGLVIPREKSDGYYDRFRNRIVFPIFDLRARCIGFGARGMTDEAGAKYINSPETDVYTKGNHLYGFHLSKDAVAKEDAVVIAEGYMDFLIPFQAGFKNIVASLGTALTIDQIRLIQRYTKNVVMLFDTDTAGQAAMLRSLDLLIEEGMHVKVATLEQGEDPDSFICKHGAEAFKEQILKADSFFDYKLERLRQQGDAGSIEGRAKIASEMLVTIDKFPNEVIKAGYLKQLAYELSLEEKALAAEYEKFSRPASRKEGKPQEAVEPAQRFIRSVEYNILKLMLEEESLIPLTREGVSTEDFQDDSIRAIVTKVFELSDHGKEVNASRLMSCFNDTMLLEIISKLMVVDESLIGDKRKIHQDCISRIKKDRVKIKRKYLCDEIRQAEYSGDHTKLDKLKRELNQLIKG